MKIRSLFITALLLTTNLNAVADSYEIILEIMRKQTTAWNNGDINAFMAPYARGDELSFISKDEISNGWQQTLDRYKLRYPNKEAMGKLQFDIKDYIQLSHEYAWVMGKYTVRTTGAQFTGHFTLVWQYIDGNWRIIRDHSS